MTPFYIGPPASTARFASCVMLLLTVRASWLPGWLAGATFEAARERSADSVTGHAQRPGRECCACLFDLVRWLSNLSSGCSVLLPIVCT
jgi:hypothetical protein